MFIVTVKSGDTHGNGKILFRNVFVPGKVLKGIDSRENVSIERDILYGKLQIECCQSLSGFDVSTAIINCTILLFSNL